MPRGKGGFPTAADSGDSVPEVLKREIGDSEPFESEDPRDKNNRTGTEEERGAKRSIGDWEELTRQIKIRAERRRARTQEKVWTSTSFMLQKRSEQCQWGSPTRISTRPWS